VLHSCRPLGRSLGMSTLTVTFPCRFFFLGSDRSSIPIIGLVRALPHCRRFSVYNVYQCYRISTSHVPEVALGEILSSAAAPATSLASQIVRRDDMEDNDPDPSPSSTASKGKSRTYLGSFNCVACTPSKGNECYKVVRINFTHLMPFEIS